MVLGFGKKEDTAPAPLQTVNPPAAGKISLTKGTRVTLEKHAAIVVSNGWTAAGKDYDLKALVRYHDGRLVYVGAANADEVLSTPEGAVRHHGDVTQPGELEKITITWHP